MTSTTTPATGGGTGGGTGLDALLAGVGDASTAPGDLLAVSTDRSGTPPGTPARAVVRPRTAAEVQHVLRWCTATGTPVVPRGAGSGLAGAAVAEAGGVVLDLSRMDRIVELDAAEQVAVVEPGVVTADLDAAAAAHGLMFAPDPGSVGTSTVGGNIATNAGGLRGAKHGVTRDAVLGLDVVLADGRLISVGRRTVKGVTGYDLVSLFTGSEGTLGVVVRATVRLLPRPQHVVTAAAFFPAVEDAAGAAAAITASGVRPLLLELVDGPVLAAIDAARGSDLAARGGAFLLVQTDGTGAAQEMERLVEVVRPFASSVETAADPAEAERLVAARRDALPSLERLGRLLIEDVAVPRSRLPEAVRGVKEAGARHGVPVYVVAHAGDGNLHPVLLLEGDHDGTGIPPAAQRAADDVFALALELGGTVTGEHGVGTLKLAHAARELGEDVLGLQQQLKAVFDPAGVLNPGKALPAPANGTRNPR